MVSDPQWIIAVAAVFSSIGVVFIAAQAFYALKNFSVAKDTLINAAEQLNLNRLSIEKTNEQIQLSRQGIIDTHELERRKKAIVLLTEWVKYIGENGTGAKGFCEKLSIEESRHIWNEEEFKVHVKHKDYLERNIPGIGSILKNSSCRADEVLISSAQAAIIRQQATSYLNLLETIFTARFHNVADSYIIKSQFTTLIVPESGKELLPHLRKIAGGRKAFPSIEEFVNEVMSELNLSPPRKEPTGGGCINSSEIVKYHSQADAHAHREVSEMWTSAQRTDAHQS